MKTLTAFAALATFALIGCAHTSAPADVATRTTPQLVSHENLHLVEAVSHTALKDGQASADLRVCVSPDGRADSVVLEKSSGSAWFDNAVATELAAARYASFKAPKHVRLCGPMKVVVNDQQ